MSKKKGTTKEKAKRSVTDKTATLEPTWMLAERVVALLEKSLTPHAEVLHNQKLRNVATGHGRQCDVVVKYGKPPRQLTEIVEVQKRNAKVGIATFDAWWQKKQSLGVELLICVSAIGYSQSVKDQVAKVHGPCVRLLTLRELETSNAIKPEVVFRLPEGSTSPDKPYGVVYGPGPLGPESKVPVREMKLYVEGREKPVTINQLLVVHFDRFGPMPLNPGHYEQDILINVGHKIFAEHAGIRQEVLKLKVLTRLTIHQVTLPLVFASYEQVDIEGAIAWAAIADGTIAGETFPFRMTYVPNGNGQFDVRAESTIAPRGGYILMGTPIQANS